MGFFRFILEPYKGQNTRYTCPICQTKRSYCRYIDVSSGEYLPFEYGRCNRSNKCSYHLNPYKNGFKGTAGVNEPFQRNPFLTASCRIVLKRKEPASFIPMEIVSKSLRRYDFNNFVCFLIGLFGVEAVNSLISRYCIGTSSHWQGATVFWQKDIDGNIRTGKIMLYSPISGKRIKEPYSLITWVHHVLKIPGFSLNQCLFGEHLLNECKTKQVAIVESEKTAIICSIYKPEFIWLATGSLGNLSDKICRVLKGRDVTLFPDLGAYDRWSLKAERLKKIGIFKVSKLLEENAINQVFQKGGDLADYFLQLCCKV